MRFLESSKPNSENSEFVVKNKLRKTSTNFPEKNSKNAVPNLYCIQHNNEFCIEQIRIIWK